MGIKTTTIMLEDDGTLTLDELINFGEELAGLDLDSDEVAIDISGNTIQVSWSG